MTQGDNRAEFELRRLRKDGPNNAGAPAGYSSKGGAREVQGDDDAPFQKLPPFPTDRQLLLVDPALPVGAYGASEEFDIEAVRLLTLWVDYTSAEDGSILSIVPEVRNADGGEPWTPIGAIDAVLTTVVLPTLSGSYGSRIMQPAEFRSPTVANGQRHRLAVVFDVGPYKQMRFLAGNVAAVADGGLLELRGSKAD